MKRAIALTLATAFGAAASASAAQNYGDTLVAQEMAQHRELIGLCLYATPPKSSDFAMVAASDASSATAATSTAQTAQRSGKPLQVRSTDGSALSTYLPLLDVAGEPIGTVAITLPYRGETDSAGLLKQATTVRDELRRRVINVANLLDPYPYVQDVQASPYAQQLVDRIMARHPELLVLALHVRNASGSDYPIIASNIGRIGKKADGDDMHVVQTGEPLMGAYGPNKSRFGIELPMHDAHGTRIGAMSVGYRHQAGDDEQALLKRALQVEAEMREQIPSNARLIAPGA